MVLRHVLDPTLEEAETAFRQVHEHHAALIQFLRDLGVPLPKPMATAAEFALNFMLRRELETEPLDVDRVHSLMEQVRTAKVTLDETTLEYAARRAMEKAIRQFAADPDNSELLSRIEARVAVVNSFPFPVVLWTPQNIWFDMHRTVFDGFQQRAAAGDKQAGEWVERFRHLGQNLSIQVD
jgi:hypothetical protein